MKLHVICNGNGEIVSLHAGEVTGPQAANSRAGVTPRPEHTLHTIEVTEELAGLPLAEIRRLFVVDRSHGAPRLRRIINGGPRGGSY